MKCHCIAFLNNWKGKQRMKIKTICYSICGVALSSLSYSAIAGDNDNDKVIPGYVAHGINTYNGKHIGDYSKVSPLVPWLGAFPAVREIGVLTPGGNDGSEITAATDRSLPVATTRSFLDFFNPGGRIDLNLVNKPLNYIGVNYFGYTAVDDRVVPTSFPVAGTGPSIYRAKGINEAPTVGEWEQIKGQLRITHKSDGSSDVRITIRNAFPNSVYTAWDVGAKAPLTKNEKGYAVPLGGLPNIILTDSKGCGYKKLSLPYALDRTCVEGAESCTSYVSVFYHWDSQVYGASPAGAWVNAPTGLYAANQMVWPITGDLLQAPATNFGDPSTDGCSRTSKN